MPTQYTKHSPERARRDESSPAGRLTEQNETLAQHVNRDFLPFVRKPARYIGGEVNQIKKDLAKADLTVALCFPDTYEIAMSHTGLAIIYHALNLLPNVAAERAFAPWLDAEKILRSKNIPLFTLESKTPLKDFDVIGFSMTTELCCTNVLNMLDLAGLKIRSADRSDSDPIVVAGGGIANSCEPVADFIDLFILGEAEYAVVELANLIIDKKKKHASKNNILLTAAKKFDWAYIPHLYKFDYGADKIKSFTPTVPGLRTTFKNAVVEDLDTSPVPDAPIVPFVQPIHERLSIEIMRGCPHRCRFCQASFSRRPVRYRSVERILEIAKAAYHNTGLDTVGLLSLSSADYPHLEELIDKLTTCFRDKHVGISLPSLRVDKQLKLLPKLVSSVRKAGLTIAVEAAREDLRQIINKPIKNDDLFAAVKAAYKAGYQKLKLYFLVGLPGETARDIRQIPHLASRLAMLRKTIAARPAQINVTVSWLVPKPHSPFAFIAQKPKDYFENAKQIILDQKIKLRANYLHFKFHDINLSILESAIARGDRRLADVIETAFKNGARFDLWSESFDYSIWRNAFEKCGMNLEARAKENFNADDILPFEHLGGPDKKYLFKHFTDATALAESRTDRPRHQNPEL